jgi:two-component system cell cycle response regulator CtrA
MTRVLELEDRIAELEEILGLNIKLPGELALTKTLTQMAGLLIKKEVVSSDMFYDAIYGGRPECDQPLLKIIDVQLCKLRKQLALVDVTIRNRWGRGWYLDAADRAKLRGMVAA